MQLFVISDKVLPEPRHLPYLVINSDLTLFSSNAAMCYFLPPQENIASVYDWLEWEANKLSPALAQLGIDQKNENIKISVFGLLKILDKGVKKFLVGVSFSKYIFLITNNVFSKDVLSAADISIWSSIYPLYRCKNAQEFFCDLPNLIHWLEYLQNLESFKVI